MSSSSRLLSPDPVPNNGQRSPRGPAHRVYRPSRIASSSTVVCGFSSFILVKPALNLCRRDLLARRDFPTNKLVIPRKGMITLVSVAKHARRGAAVAGERAALPTEHGVVADGRHFDSFFSSHSMMIRLTSADMVRSSSRAARFSDSCSFSSSLMPMTFS